MNVFDLFAKLTLDTSDFEKQVTDASKSFNKLGGAAEDIPGDTQKAEKAVDKFTKSVEETTNETNQAEAALNDAERSLRDVGKEADKASPPIEEAADGLKNVGETSGGADGALAGLGKTITGAVTKGHLLAAAIEFAASTIKNFAESVWNMDESTEEFRPADLPKGWDHSPAEDARHWITKATEQMYYDLCCNEAYRLSVFTREKSRATASAGIKLT